MTVTELISALRDSVLYPDYIDDGQQVMILDRDGNLIEVTSIDLDGDGDLVVTADWNMIHPEPAAALPAECRCCGADWNHGVDLSPDQWEAHREDSYQDSREHGATRDGADHWAEFSTISTYGARPLGPSRPFGPWRDPAYVAAHLDHRMRGLRS